MAEDTVNTPGGEQQATLPPVETVVVSDAPAQTSEDDVMALLAFDPFPKGETPKSQEAPANQASADGGQPAVTPKPVEPGTEEPKPEASELELLKKTVQELQAEKAKPPAEPQSSQQTEEGPTIPEYRYDIPESLMAGLASEDVGERKAAIGALAQGVSQTVHQQVLAQVGQMVSAVVPRMIFQAQHTQRVQEEVKTDFYGKYKELDNQQYYPIVQQVALTIMQETGQTEWSPTFRDALAVRVKQLLNLTPAQPAVVVPPTPQTFMAGGAARHQAGSSPEDDINNTLFG